MTTSVSPALLTLIFIVLVIMAIAQFVFFFWLFRKLKRDTPPTTPAQFNFICKIIAGSLFTMAAALVIYSAFLITIGVQTIGTVIELRENYDKDRDTTYFAPTFTFVDSSGATNTVNSGLSTSAAAYRVGEQVPVVYPKSNPSMARINRFGELWLAPIALSVFGVIALLAIPIYRKWRELGAKP